MLVQCEGRHIGHDNLASRILLTNVCDSQDWLTCNINISRRALFGASNACHFARHMWASLLERCYQQALHQLAWFKNVPSLTLRNNTPSWNVFDGACFLKQFGDLLEEDNTFYISTIFHRIWSANGPCRMMPYRAGWFTELEETLAQPSWS